MNFIKKLFKRKDKKQEVIRPTYPTSKTVYERKIEDMQKNTESTRSYVNKDDDSILTNPLHPLNPIGLINPVSPLSIFNHNTDSSHQNT